MGKGENNLKGTEREGSSTSLRVGGGGGGFSKGNLSEGKGCLPGDEDMVATTGRARGVGK